VIKTDFGSSPVFFATAELGGGHSTAATGSQTTSSTINETVDLTQLANKEDLAVGFYGGESLGAGVTQVTFNLYVNGSDVDSQTFSTAAAAKAYFTNNAINLGSLAGESSLSVEAQLAVTSTAAGSGFYGEVIIGDPPPSSAGAAPSQPLAATSGRAASGAPIEPQVVTFVQTAAAFAPLDSANVALVSNDALSGRTPLLHATGRVSAGHF
jgi:hypothetical protein